MTINARHLALFALILASPVGAQGLNGTSSGLSNPAQTVTFDGYADGTVAGNQFFSQGVTFSHGLSLNSDGFFQYVGGGMGSLDNFTLCHCATSPFSIYFSHAVNGAAFQFLTNNNTATSSFTAVLHGQDVYSYAANTGLSAMYSPRFYGFDSSITLDEIRFVPEQQVNGAMLLDNLELGQAAGGRIGVTATPEPASVALVATGLLGIVGFARRRRDDSVS